MQNRVMIIVAGILFLLAVFLGTAIFVALFLTARMDHSIPVAAQQIPANSRIREDQLEMVYQDQPPPENIITDINRIVGSVAAENIPRETEFTEDLLRDYFELFQTTRSVPAGNRLEQAMLEPVQTEDRPRNAIDDLSWLLDRMVREGIPAGTVVTQDHVYVEEHTVVVADRRIRPNSLIRIEDLVEETRPVVPDDAVTNRTALAGRAIRTGKVPGEVIRESDLYDEKLQLSYFIPMYRRAVGIEIDLDRSVSHMIRPGDLVDLYVYQAKQYSAQEMERFSGTGDRVHLLQKLADGAEILALNRGDRNIWSSDQVDQVEEQEGHLTYDGITLALTLKEAEKVSLVKGMKYRGLDMRFYVILRPRILESQYGLRSLTDFELFYRRSKSEVDDLIKSRPVEVIQGDQQEIYRVPDRR